MKDDRLSSESQRQAAEWVRELLEEEAPSMVWRANLNESLRAEAAKRARNRWRWAVARPALGLATAAALALVVLFPRPAPAPPKGRLEANLVAMYEDSAQTADIVGAGLRPSEATATTIPDVDPLVDLDAGAL